jgi:hypothetical protein
MPGQVVEILDQGPYRENLWIENPPADTGIVSRNGTILLPTQWRTAPFSPTFANAHRVVTSTSFRLTGVALLDAVGPIDSSFMGANGISWTSSGRSIVEACTFVGRPLVGLVDSKRYSRVGLNTRDGERGRQTDVLGGVLTPLPGLAGGVVFCVAHGMG